MKWIGAHIWDWVTRFRNDVYFEDTTADASTNALVVDSNGKVGVNSSLVGLLDVVDDSTPQLGGDLDVNGQSIVSAGNGNIVIDPSGTGSITLKSDSIIFEGAGQFTLPSLRLTGATLLGSNYLGFTVPLTVTASQLWTLPDGDGTSGQAMATSGAGILSWTSFLLANNPLMFGNAAIRPVNPSTPAYLTIYDLDASNFIALRAPADVTTNYTLTLPPDDGTTNQVLRTDGSGVTSWVNQASGTDTYLGSTDQTLANNRLITLDGNALTIQATSATNNINAIFDNDGGLTIGPGGSQEAAFLEIREASANGVNHIKLIAPTALGSNVDLTLPSADGTSGQALTTDGSGNLSFSTVGGGGGGGGSSSLLIAYGGRVQHSTSFDNRMIICGGIYGPSYYIWSSAAGVTASGGGTIDTTTFALPSSYQHYGSIIMPSAGQVKVDFLAKPLNSSSYSKPYVMQLWEFTPTIGTTSGPTCTLRAKVNMTSSSSASYASATMTSTSDITAGKYVFVTIGMDAQTLSTTAYQYMNVNVTLLA